MNGTKTALVIGASNIDIAGKSKNKILPFDSNIGEIKLSHGGVGRNIAHNLALLGVSTSFMTAFGNDLFATELKNCLQNLGMDISHSMNFDAPTSTYLFVADQNGEMQVAVNDMSIYNLVTKEVISKNLEYINSHDVIIVDTNLVGVLEFVLKNATKPVIVDTVSVAKCENVKPYLEYCFALKPNLIEAECLTGIKIHDIESLEKAGDEFMRLGVKNIFISMGKEGVFAQNEKERYIVPSIRANAVNATGAGDSFVASLAYGFLQGYELKELAKTGVAASSITIESEKTVSEKMSNKLVEERKKSI